MFLAAVLIHENLVDFEDILLTDKFDINLSSGTNRNKIDL